MPDQDESTVLRCESVYIHVANEDVDFCQLPAGHEGKHRQVLVTEWTDEAATDAESRWC